MLRFALRAAGRLVVVAVAASATGQPPQARPGHLQPSLAAAPRGSSMDGVLRVSVRTDGTESGDHSTSASLSADGMQVAFVNRMRVPTNFENWTAIHVHDRTRGVTSLVSGVDGHGFVHGNSRGPVVSSTGRYVAFESEFEPTVEYDSNRGGIFVHDRDFDGDGVFDETAPWAVRTIAVDVSSAGVTARRLCARPAMTPDGRFVAFETAADNLVPDDTNYIPASFVPTGIDVFVHDRDADADGLLDETDAGGRRTVRVSIASDGAQSNGNSTRAALSADGRFVAFESVATNLVGGDANNVADVFLYDRDADANGVYDEPGGVQTTRVGLADGGGEANGSVGRPGLSADGNLVVFVSAATNLVDGDVNGRMDVFLRDLAAGQTICVSRGADGLTAAGHSFDPSISPNGRRVAFVSLASNLVAGDANGLADVFVFDRDADEDGVFDEPDGVSTDRILGENGAEPDFPGGEPAFAGDSHALGFTSLASNLVSADTNLKRDVFVHPGVGCAFVHFTEQPVSSSVCPAAAVTLSALASGQAPLSYQWRKDGAPIPDATAPSHTIQAFGTGDVATYALVAANECGASLSAAARLELGFAPFVAEPFFDAIGCQGGTARFTAEVTTAPPATAQWRKDGEPILGADQPALMIGPLGPPDAGAYDLLLSNACADTRVEGFLFRVATDPASFGCRRWEALQFAAFPPVRRGYAVAYDPDRQAVVLFGGEGSDGALSNEVWEWRGGDWTLRPTTNSPPARRSHAMSYDRSRQAMVVFGGIGWSGSNAAALLDTWELHGDAWIEATAAGSPPASSNNQMVYHPGRQRSLLLGYSSDGMWEWDGQAWARVPPYVPPPRYGFGLSYDAPRQRLVLFGGQREQQYLDDTWEWDGVTWQQVWPLKRPPARHSCTLTAAPDGVVMFGGYDGRLLNDTWLFDGHGWVSGALATRPAPRRGHVAAYDEARNDILIVGGDQLSENERLWQLTLAHE